MNKHREKETLFHNLTALASGQFAGRGIRFLYMLTIARMLGPEQTGVYLYGIALYLGVIGIGQFGQEMFLAQRIGKHGGAFLPILSHSLTLVLSVTLVVAVGLALFVWVSEPEPLLRLTILCFVGTMVARGMALWVRTVYVALERPAWIPKYEVVFRGSEALAGVGALYAGGGLLAVSLLHFLFWIIEAGFALRKLAREHPGALGLAYHRGYLKKIAAVSLLFLIGAAAMAQFPQIAIILLRKLQPDGAFVGHFGIAMQFMTTLMVIPLSASQAFLPHLSRAFSRGNGDRDLIAGIKLIGVLALAGSITAAAYGPWFITLVLGSNYAETASLFRWLCWMLTPYAVAIFLCRCMSLINGRGKAAFITVTMTISHAILLVAYMEQSPAIAAIGSMVLSAVGGMVIAMHQVNRQLGLSRNSWWLKFILLMLATYTVFESGWAPSTVTAPAALATGAVVMRLLHFFDKHDIDIIRRLFGRDRHLYVPA
ncbi:MAG: oligosaccharide flippase family protein [Gammaproteobacteria bacterium]|nr:oligosaccharide flippase family protein [Gammaproteobacteria bacterium]NNJ83352.1 oligosaccharide flippase family protein [Gammaproteobacteria bacterium]